MCSLQAVPLSVPPLLFWFLPLKVLKDLVCDKSFNFLKSSQYHSVRVTEIKGIPVYFGLDF